MKIIEIDNKKGVYNEEGKVLIECKYDFIEYLQDCNCYKCGRDGIFHKGKAGFAEIKEFYTGVYDLYSNNGELLLGGFGDFYYHSIFDLFFFHFGGHWCISEWSNGYMRGEGKWIVLGRNMEPIYKWNRFHYSCEPIYFKGTIVSCFKCKYQEITKLKFIRNLQSTIIDLPDELMFEDYKIFLECQQIVVQTKQNYRTIFLQYKTISNEYRYIHPIDSKYSYTLEFDAALGIATTDNSKGIYNKYDYITKPYKGWSLAIGRMYSFPRPREFGDMMYCVLTNDEKMWDPFLIFRDVHDSLVEQLLQKNILKIEDIELDSEKKLVSVTFPKKLGDFIKYDDKIVPKIKTCDSLMNETLPNRNYMSLVDIMNHAEHRYSSSYGYHESCSMLNDAFDGEAELYNEWLLNS